MVNFSFNYKNKKYSLDVKECRSIFSKGSGLMFRKKSRPLLFIFDNPVNEAIHSFFCISFIAIWLNNGEVVDAKLVLPWKTSIRSKEKFDRLLEIPENYDNFEKFKIFF